jgi:HK97 family phage major capsid protein
MAARMVPGGFERAFWCIHSAVLPQLWTMVLGTTPIMLPDFTKSPFGTVLGRPVYVSEYASAYNSVGDLALIDPAGLGVAIRAEGIQTAATIGFAFDQGLQSFRVTMRIGVTPLLSAAVARKNGNDTMSHIVALGVRS